jgi:hypothetical protein
MYLVEQLKHIREYVDQNISGLNEEQLNWKILPSRWSVAQCLHHLIVTNAKYFETFDQILNKGYRPTSWERVSPFTAWWGKQLLKSTEAFAAVKLRAPKVFAPSNGVIETDIATQFLEHQDHLIRYFEQLHAITKRKNITITSPASSIVTLNLRTSMRAIVQHEQRHINQANNVLHHAHFPKY